MATWRFKIKTSVNTVWIFFWVPASAQNAPPAAFTWHCCTAPLNLIKWRLTKCSWLIDWSSLSSLNFFLKLGTATFCGKFFRFLQCYFFFTSETVFGFVCFHLQKALCCAPQTWYLYGGGGQILESYRWPLFLLKSESFADSSQTGTCRPRILKLD